MKNYFLLFASLFLLFSCSKDKTPDVKAILVVDGYGVNDKSYNASAWEGLLSFYGDSVGDEKYFGTLYDVAMLKDEATFFTDIKKVSSEDCDAIILTSYSFASFLDLLCSIFPEKKYITFDNSGETEKNVQNYIFATYEGSFLVGLCAALQSIEDSVLNPEFGFIGGIPSDVISDFELGYIQGIRAVFPDAKIYDFYVNDWGSPQIAFEKTGQWYDKGVYAVYSAAGLSGNGTIAQAVAHRKNGRNVWAIGVDRDQFEEGIYGMGKSAVLTSMIKNTDKAVIDGLKSIQNGQFKSGNIELGLKEGALSFSTSNSALKESVIKQISVIQEDIINGKLNVLSIKKDKKAAEELLRTVIHE